MNELTKTEIEILDDLMFGKGYHSHIYYSTIASVSKKQIRLITKSRDTGHMWVEIHFSNENLENKFGDIERDEIKTLNELTFKEQFDFWQSIKKYSNIISEEFISLAFNYAKKEIQTLDSKYKYHNWDHTEYVFNQCKIAAKELSLGNRDKQALLFAALFHDIGFIKNYRTHEQESKVIAKEYCLKRNKPSSFINSVLQMIENTKLDSESNVEYKMNILRDIDLSYGIIEYQINSSRLRTEWELLNINKYSKAEWINLQKAWINKLEFQTKYANLKYKSDYNKAKYLINNL